MSLSGLSKFMDKKYQWGSVKLQGKVVVKGDALCYYLYNQYMWQCGGHYYEFYNTITKFFSTMKDLQISPCVVMNGALTDEKIYRKRCVKRLDRISEICVYSTATKKVKALPLFAKTVFIDALKDLKVDITIADGDGDPVCVSLANTLECPMLGYDGDFFIFNIHGGYIPLYDESGNPIDFGEKVRCYNFAAFDLQYGMTSPDQRLYIPLLLNKEPRRDIMALLEKIRTEPQYSGHERSEYSYGIELPMRPIRSFYRGQSRARPYGEIVRDSRLPNTNPAIPRWILTAYKSGRFSHQMMYFLCCKNWRYANVIEDTSKPSAWSVTKKPRRYLLGSFSTLLEDVGDISDTTRTAKPFNLDESVVKLKAKHCDLFDFPLDSMPERDATERQRILIKAFNCKHIQFSVDRVPAELRLAVVASRAWLKTDEEHFTSLVTPLVSCMLSCSGLFPMPAHVPTGTTLVDQASLDRLHCLAQWQCMLHHAIAFNQLLCNAFQYTSPARLFSCAVFEHFYQHPPPLMGELASKIIGVITKQ